MEPLEHMASHGIADVEVHLHHNGEGQQNFVDLFSGCTETLFSRHGLLREHNGIITSDSFMGSGHSITPCPGAGSAA